MCIISKSSVFISTCSDPLILSDGFQFTIARIENAKAPIGAEAFELFYYVSNGGNGRPEWANIFTVRMVLIFIILLLLLY